jgi:L-2-hydroxyglutarate oxidase
MLDYIVIGGGIVGVATARELTRREPQAGVLLLEKEHELAAHQTGRNSGVIHAGVYYTPGSLKAQFCKIGRALTVAFCKEHNVPHKITGKLLVAANALEVERAQALGARCAENGIEHDWLDAKALARIEPYVAGLAAICVPSTGIADYAALTQTLARLYAAAGGALALGQEVIGLSEGPDRVVVETATRTYEARRLIVCAGLQSDRLARMLGLGASFRIVPFRGEYFRLNRKWNDRFSHLIYPIPDPALPFLGVHITKLADGGVTVGPNAVLGLAREGYSKFSANLRDGWEVLAYPGFWLAMKPHLRSGLSELANSAFPRLYLRLCRKYCPELTLDDFEPHPSGIRAQAVWADGRMEHDFLIVNSPRSIHVCNAPSPAATSALPIAEYIVDEAMKRLGGNAATAPNRT